MASRDLPHNQRNQQQQVITSGSPKAQQRSGDPAVLQPRQTEEASQKSGSGSAPEIERVPSIQDASQQINANRPKKDKASQTLEASQPAE